MESLQVAKRIRAFRKLRGLTQQQLSERVRISVSVLGEIERGNRQIDDQIMKEICKQLNISHDELASPGSFR
ncbi:helix-turn-helix transcriptional regulator [Paenibacillaceae sp. P-4]|uniref:Helix-turn-helix transcriptional regulator n=1 Tax=Paenibacillus suaedae TaxID=3077233 RepID=A0AAJ2N855_9BACL|nr:MULTISPECIES: helix-turn-helix transcriptional regulator [unclassified Paenibacillus]MDT8980250.1 helix-turn-helix transcriptional regulator [Paenibacillus sp. chi10]GAV15922.1 hypothetical protein PBN151_5907 [Paenibacillus sp. NAIST15-1]